VKLISLVMKKKSDPSGLFIPGGLLIGIGLGIMYGQTAVGTLVGLGAGFILMAIFQMLRKK